MVRISDILKRGRSEEEEPRKKKPEGAKKEKITPISAKEIKEKKKLPLETKKEQLKEKMRRPPVSQLEIARVMMEKTKAGRPEAEQIYQELIDLIKVVLTKGKENEPTEGKEIMVKIDRVVDQMGLAADELIALTVSSTPDNYLFAHVVNVCLLSIKVGLALGYNKSRLNELGVSGFLYDIGMIKVMDIAQHPRRLTTEEYQAIKQHPIYGVEILEKAKDLTKVVIYVAHQQHERMNGVGYPRSLKDDEISEYARIVGVVDVYEALTHPRPYRKKFLPYEAMKEILKNKDQFDLRFLKVLIQEIGIYPIGSWVGLNTNEVGKVIRVNKDLPLRPTVNVIFGPDGRKLDEVKTLDLSKHPTLYIKKTLDDSELEARFTGSK